MELVRQQRNGGQLLVGDLDARRIFVGVQLCAYFQPLIGLGVIIAIKLTTASWLRSGWQRQFSLIKEKSRCSILFHLLVPGGKWHTVRWRPVSSANLLKYTPKHFIVKLLVRHKLLVLFSSARSINSTGFIVGCSRLAEGLFSAHRVD